ncbi:MAG TPA: aldehyde dehydrogenase family protein, partial [Candidatus Limnocylindrales bacterium]|nr:aldehyde dehydrogenase family protein [Candidatus Limnocylindrales bacterium]
MLLDVLVDRRDDTREPPTLGSIIGGTLKDPSTDDLIAVGDPATGRPLATIEDAGSAGVDAAVTAAAVAARDWRRTPARERGALVASLAD